MSTNLLRSQLKSLVSQYGVVVVRATLDQVTAPLTLTQLQADLAEFGPVREDHVNGVRLLVRDRYGVALLGEQEGLLEAGDTVEIYDTDTADHWHVESARAAADMLSDLLAES